MNAAALQMDRLYRRQRHIYDASRKFYLLGRDDLVRALQPPPGGAILEVGCGTARNLVVAARYWPGARLYGVDISAEMLASSARSIISEGLIDRIQLAQGNAVDFDPGAAFGVQKFDRVFLSYALSIIPPWREALAHALDLVAPNGALHIVDFGGFDRLPRWFGRGMNGWLAAFGVAPRVDLEAAVTAQATPRGMAVRGVGRFRGYAVHVMAIARPERHGAPGRPLPGPAPLPGPSMV